MTLEQKCLLAIEKGFSYNSDTGEIFGVNGRLIKGKHSQGYIKVQFIFDDKNYEFKGHQFAWFCKHNETVDFIDHINGNKSDNRLSNLRSVTKQENVWNQLNAKGSTYNSKLGKWQAKISLNSKNKYLGLYDTQEEANLVYRLAKDKYHTIGNVSKGIEKFTKDKREVKGYYFHKGSQKYIVRKMINNERHNIGNFNTEQEAINCINTLKSERRGELC